MVVPLHLLRIVALARTRVYSTAQRCPHCGRLSQFRLGRVSAAVPCLLCFALRQVRTVVCATPCRCAAGVSHTSQPPCWGRMDVFVPGVGAQVLGGWRRYCERGWRVSMTFYRPSLQGDWVAWVGGWVGWWLVRSRGLPSSGAQLDASHCRLALLPVAPSANIGDGCAVTTRVFSGTRPTVMLVYRYVPVRTSTPPPPLRQLVAEEATLQLASAFAVPPVCAHLACLRAVMY